MKLQKWEYRTERNITEHSLNQFGFMGWELVSTIHKIEANSIWYFFKRPL